VYGLLEMTIMDPLFGAGLNQYRAQLNLPPVRHVMGKWCHSPDRVIGLFPAWFAPPQPDWPPQTVLTGFPLFDESDVTPMPAEVARFLDGGTPPIAFTPGSAMLHGRDFFSAAAEACRLIGRRGLLLTRHGEQIPPNLPDGVIHAPFVPFSQALPRCAALVHHGGIGTTAQGMSCGVPQLIMPMSYDQPDNAERVVKLGIAGVLSPRSFKPANVARTLNDLLSSKAVGEACRRVAARFQGGPNPLDETVRVIENMEASAVAA
jgi:UDP:flavonoid glycosyltransferase YjiC (YdhE family)